MNVIFVKLDVVVRFFYFFVFCLCLCVEIVIMVIFVLNVYMLFRDDFCKRVVVGSMVLIMIICL